MEQMSAARKFFTQSYATAIGLKVDGDQGIIGFVNTG
jgi:hypothetical protein